MTNSNLNELNEYTIRLRNFSDMPKQLAVKESPAKRRVVRAGRRGAKTVLAATLAEEAFLKGLRPLYATPTTEQLDAFWFEVCRAFQEPIDAGVLYKNEVEHIIELRGTKNRIRAKTAWNANMLRGDYTDLLILDEHQLMNEDVWGLVGAPMLLDNDGNAVFFYTPPSLHGRSVSKADDPRHASKMFAKHEHDTNGRWKTFHFTSLDNPHISAAALAEITDDMTRLAYKQEILALDTDEDPAALWSHELIDKNRVTSYGDLTRVVVGVDPPGGATECGIVTAGVAKLGDILHGYVLEDESRKASPDLWAGAVLSSFSRNSADRVVGEANFGGDMVENTIVQAAKSRGLVPVSYKHVHASRGKAIRAEPIVAMYEQGRIHHVGELPYLEDEMCQWVPGQRGDSPNRMDALVWALTELMLGTGEKPFMVSAAVSRGVGNA